MNMLFLIVKNGVEWVVSGGSDALITLHDLASSDADAKLTLVGHEWNVCALDVGQDGTIVSGSWDK